MDGLPSDTLSDWMLVFQDETILLLSLHLQKCISGLIHVVSQFILIGLEMHTYEDISRVYK